MGTVPTGVAPGTFGDPGLLRDDWDDASSCSVRVGAQTIDAEVNERWGSAGGEPGDGDGFFCVDWRGTLALPGANFDVCVRTNGIARLTFAYSGRYVDDRSTPTGGELHTSCVSFQGEHRSYESMLLHLVMAPFDDAQVTLLWDLWDGAGPRPVPVESLFHDPPPGATPPEEPTTDTSGDAGSATTDASTSEATESTSTSTTTTPALDESASSTPPPARPTPGIAALGVGAALVIAAIALRRR